MSVQPASTQEFQAGFDDSHKRLHSLHDRLTKLEAGEPLLTTTTSRDVLQDQEHEEQMEQKSAGVVEDSFWLNAKLSARVALWVTVFGLPTFDTYCSDWVFGEADHVDECGKLLGSYYNKGNTTDPQMVSWKDGDPHQIHCGILPDVYLAYWPTVMQMTIFTVFGSCGNTVMLAWQGICGTFCAVVNNVIMSCLFPKCAKDKSDYASVVQPFAHVFGEENVFDVVAWLNLIGVVWLFLCSKAETNTIKFGLSTHVCLMITFMDPRQDVDSGVGTMSSGMGFNWDAASVCWFLTALIGALVAILATLLPYPLLNITKVDNSTQAYCCRIGNQLRDALGYLCGTKKEPRGKQIAAKIEKGSDVLATVADDISFSWWECFDLGTPGRKRMLYEDYYETLVRINPLMRSVRRCLLQEDFKGWHTSFFSASMARAMHDLCDQTKKIMITISSNAEDGVMSREETEYLKQEVDEIKKSQKNLVTTYIMATKSLRHLNSATAERPGTLRQDLGSEYSFLSALSFLAKRQVEFANTFLDQEGVTQRKLAKKSVRDYAAVQSLERTWSPSAMMEKEQRRYAMRNSLSIIGTFWMAMSFKTTMFTEYSFVMPMTLTMLITRTPIGTFSKSTQRLQGVALGKILPLLSLTLVNLTDCGSNWNIVWHVLAIFVFMWGFLYMSYTSLQFAAMGCFVAAFGCSFFFVRCEDRDFSASFSDRYKEIGQIVCSVVVMMIVDTFFREKPVAEKAKDAIKSLKEQFKNGYVHFFAGETLMQDYYTQIEEAVAYAQGLVAELDPKLEVAPGWNPPFRYKLYCALMPLFKTFASDFNMLLLATGTAKSKKAGEKTKWEGALSVAKVMADSNGQLGLTGLRDMKEELFEILELVFSGALILLSHKSGEQIKDAKLDKLTKDASEKKEDFSGTEIFIEQLNGLKELHHSDDQMNLCENVNEILQVRMQTSLNALSAAKKSLNEIADCVVTHNVNV